MDLFELEYGGGEATPAPATKPATARPSPAAKPSTPVAKPATPVAKSATPVAKPVTPAAKPATPATKPATPAAKPGSPGFSFGSFAPFLKQGLDVARFGAQTAQQFKRPAAPPPSAPAGEPAGAPPAMPPGAGMPPSYDPSAPSDAPAAPGQGGDQAQLLQALKTQQIPPLPGASGEPPSLAPRHSDGMALLALILSHPQFQQALQQAGAHGAAAARTVPLQVPSTSVPSQTQVVPVPLGAVMNAIVALAGRSQVELNAATAEDDPEVPSYLVNDDGNFIVDPTSSTDRAALVAHLFRLSDAAAQQGSEWSEASEDAGELDESEEFAVEAGFF